MATFFFQLKSMTSYHVVIALVIAAWLSLFLILIAPFDIAELPISIRLEIMPVYGLIAFVGYILLIPLQNFGYKKIVKQSVPFEVFNIILFNLLVLAGSYVYYKSGIVNGAYSFVKFAIEVYYPIFFILLPIIVVARWLVSRKMKIQKEEKLVLIGENKLDILQISHDDLVAVSSADNYVEVSYLIHGTLHKKLLRTTLRNIESQLPKLVKVHRSHLINPLHFKEWKDANILLLTQIEVPVSRNYKKDILAMNHSSLKSNHSPLSL